MKLNIARSVQCIAKQITNNIRLPTYLCINTHTYMYIIYMHSSVKCNDNSYCYLLIKKRKFPQAAYTGSNCKQPLLSPLLECPVHFLRREGSFGYPSASTYKILCCTLNSGARGISGAGGVSR